MFKWQKLGLVFDPTTMTTIDWMKQFAQAPSTLILDNIVRVYFSCRPPRDAVDPARLTSRFEQARARLAAPDAMITGNLIPNR